MVYKYYVKKQKEKRILDWKLRRKEIFSFWHFYTLIIYSISQRIALTIKTMME